ncbi:MAG: tRNA (guanosine(46)-N7)-methyltransferase TrmB [Gammaproteobacteria bacterium]|nr:tRNA (guanosine(46)-N7)-methyltransferase TrmB [Gammaproteobacteria bacterium]
MTSDNTSQSRFPRAIRSFVKRQGRMTTGQRRALDEHWAEVGVDFSDTALDLTSVFGREAPVILEIGFGNGDNLADLAEQNPQQNFLGIEVHEPGVGACIMKAIDRELDNVRVMRHDAVEVLRESIPGQSLSRVNLFFPDPWHKKRHHKRRIVQPDFVRLLAEKLQPGGVFHVATDWPNYAEHIAAIMTASDQFAALEQCPDDRSVSRFDTRGQKLGHENWERAWVRI